MAKGLCPECEDLAIDSSGTVYAGASDGRILVFSPDFKQNRTLAQTGGRPLGLAADNKGNIYVADGAKGCFGCRHKGRLPA
jgi:sugar lactone lactonase YvrE